jgi:cell division control protein 7
MEPPSSDPAALSIPCMDDFDILGPIGSGSFSKVFHAVHRCTHTDVALKRLFWNNAPDRIVKEVNWLRSLDHPNIVRLLGLFREDDQATLILNYISHVPFRDLLPQLKGDILKHYLRGLLSALAYVHSRKIIHRDVKPANFLFDPTTLTGCLIDFGLCEDDLFLESQEPPPDVSHEECYDLEHPEMCQNRPRMLANRAGTRGFRAPEVLFSTWNQSAKIDIWSAGVILLSVLSQRYPFFKSPDDLTSLVEIAVILGTDRLREAARECGRRVRFPGEFPGMDLTELCRKANPYIEELELDEQVFDLLKRMLEPVPSRRISAVESLGHPFFNGIAPAL